MNQSQVAVFAIVREFAKHAFDKPAIITGGYPRDLYFGKAPKDVDITIPLGDYHPSDAFSAAEGLWCALLGVGASISISQAYDTAESDFNERIHILMQVSCPDGAEVDIMFHKADNLSGVFSTYDSNINQVWLNDGVPVWHEGSAPVECRALKDLTPARVERLHQVAENLGIPVVSESFTVKPSKVAGEYPDDFPF